MFQFVRLLGVLAIAAGGAHSAPGGKIVGGNDTTIAAHPYQVSLETRPDVFFPNGRHICGGSFLACDIVITAAHCTEDKPWNLRVRYGTTIKGEGQVVNVRQVKWHHYRWSTEDGYDVAVLLLDKCVTMGADVQTVKLPSRPAVAGEPAVVSGWGTLSDEFYAESPKILQSATIDVVDRAECQRRFDAHPYSTYDIDPTMLCATAEGKDSCFGDSGGPLVNGDKELIGVVSWGIGCARGDYPGVYCDVFFLKDWIEWAVEELQTWGRFQ